MFFAGLVQLFPIKSVFAATPPQTGDKSPCGVKNLGKFGQIGANKLDPAERPPEFLGVLFTEKEEKTFDTRDTSSYNGHIN
ncbi:MAG TPA: hypothetical protein DGZ24_07795 [Rhodospirillaceae bacterium]|nr:hypothetical protein [Rhodospirillaceae bacterium]